jgi:hypothetical protein
VHRNRAVAERVPFPERFDRPLDSVVRPDIKCAERIKRDEFTSDKSVCPDQSVEEGGAEITADPIAAN